VCGAWNGINVAYVQHCIIFLFSALHSLATVHKDVCWKGEGSRTMPMQNADKCR